MKKIFKIFIFIIIVGILVYQFRHTPSPQFSPVLDNFLKDSISGIFTEAPCSQPIPYTLGTFDTRFDISKSYFLSALAEAEAIWEKSQGGLPDRELFVYEIENSAPDVLKINLIYDYRQQATSKLVDLGIIVKNDRTSYEMLKVKFTALKAQYDTEKSIFNAQVEAFNTRQKAYEAEVNYWNSRGGAMAKEYDKLLVEKASLKQEASELQSKQTKINAMVDEINALVVALNRLIATLNLSVDQYNAVSGTRGESFEEGVYVGDGSSSEIDIYEFSDRAKLVRVLAHELGHALGLDHVDDPKAMMYKFNQSNSLALSEADLEALGAKCGIK